MYLVSFLILAQGIKYIIEANTKINNASLYKFGYIVLKTPVLYYIEIALGVLLIVSSIGIFTKKKFGYTLITWLYTFLIIYCLGSVIYLLLVSEYIPIIIVTCLVLYFYIVLSYMRKHRSEFV